MHFMSAAQKSKRYTKLAPEMLIVVCTHSEQMQPFVLESNSELYLKVFIPKYDKRSVIVSEKIIDIANSKHTLPLSYE